MNPKQLLCVYVAFLRALYLIHQSAHWLVKSQAFYGNHLLMERLYKSAQDNADAAAEKVLGVFGSDSLSLPEMNEHMYKVLKKFSNTQNILQNSLDAEKEFLKLSKVVYDKLEASGDLTLGLDDLIMTVCSSREEAVYLLQQSLEQ